MNSAGFGAGSTACALNPYFCFKRCTAGGKLLLSAQTWEIMELPNEIWAGLHILLIHLVQSPVFLSIKKSGSTQLSGMT